MKVKSYTQTCFACPSQWEGFLEDSRPFYVRFRWGQLVIRVGSLGDSFDNCPFWTGIYNEKISDDLDGLISWEEVNIIMEGL